MGASCRPQGSLGKVTWGQHFAPRAVSKKCSGGHSEAQPEMPESALGGSARGDLEAQPETFRGAFLGLPGPGKPIKPIVFHAFWGAARG